MRLLIDTEDRKDFIFGLPWRSDGTCFNFQEPTKTISPDVAIKDPKNVETLVINCDLPDYEFISKMDNLEQLYIYKGANIYDVSFLKNLTKLNQLCLLGTHVKSFAELVELINLKYKLYKEMPENKEFIGRITYGFEGICIQSDLYEGDGTELLKQNIYRYEIWVNGKLLKR
ncbi:MAG: hypothetical protein UHU19_16100 [Lachnospiraceae bacterium]|nr:hypothetical protein [Lachnospiraceae bacterium]